MLEPRRKWLSLIAGLILATGVGAYLLVSRSREVPITAAQDTQPTDAKNGMEVAFDEPVATTDPTTKPASSAKARNGEWLARFKSVADLHAFVERARALGVRVIGSLPRLNAIRVGYDTAERGNALERLLPGGTAAELNFIVSTPVNPEPGTAAFGGPYLGFGNQALAWLGVPADHFSWGEGVKVAVLDSGVQQVEGVHFGSLREIDLIGSRSGETSSHGTAVASIVTNVAPEANVLSIKVLDSSGVGDSFTVAAGILEAVDNGARVINVSLGSEGDSSVLREAVNYALQNNVAIVAAAGNENTASVSYPAAYPGVIAVTAVDANGRHAAFANTGAVSIAAPGIAVSVPWSEASDPGTMFSGTSAAAPFVSGTIAGILSRNGSMTAREAGKLLVQYSNDSGTPGQDPVLGAGILNVDRVVNRNVAGINDIAVADVYVTPSKSGQYSATVTVQNRGTTILNSAQLEIQTGGQTWRYQLGGLNVGQVASQTIPLNFADRKESSGVSVQTRVSTTVTDVKPTNDFKTVVFRAGK